MIFLQFVAFIKVGQHKMAVLRVEEDENIVDLSPYDKYKQISSCIRL